MGDIHFCRDQDGYAVGERTFSLKRDEQGSIRVQPRPDLKNREKDVRAIAEHVLAKLAIISAPMLTNLVDDKPPQRGMTQFQRFRMAEPWNDVNRYGVPKLGKAVRPTYVADEILDEIYVLEGRIWGGVHWFELAEERSAAIKQIYHYRRGLTEALRFVLSPLTAFAAAEVAGSGSTGVDKARTLVVLPDFLTWIEWSDALCGVPGQRWGVLLQAVDDQAAQSDAQGLLFALPADWRLSHESLFQRLPMLCFELRLKSTELPLLEINDMLHAMAEAGEIDSDRLGRFLLGALTFISQPRMTEQVPAGFDPDRQAVDRARIARQLEPQVKMTEVPITHRSPQRVGDRFRD